MTSDLKISFSAGAQPAAQEALKILRSRYGEAGEDNAEIFVALGGDGFMLSQLHRRMHDGRPIYGMNRGRLGFLMNNFHQEDLLQSIHEASGVIIHPLSIHIEHATDVNEVRAINEAALFRSTHQAAHLEIKINGKTRMEELIADGLMVATPAGSTAYNYSAHGPILPLGSQLLALTPISPFRPRRWRGALLHHEDMVSIHVKEPDRRTVNATADHLDFPGVRSLAICEDPQISLTLLFDKDRALDERILLEQFATD